MLLLGVITFTPVLPSTAASQFWLVKGPRPLPVEGKEDDGAGRKFVLTPSVKRLLCNLARAVLIRCGQSTIHVSPHKRFIVDASR